MPHGLSRAAVLLALALLSPGTADAAMDKKKGGGQSGKPERMQPPPECVDATEEAQGAFMPTCARLKDMKARGFFETGLRPAYPADADCLKADSFFGVATRGDGSQRTRKFFQGLHGGLDIPASVGTPILAVADGVVVQSHEGDGIGGIGIILQHAPEDTGLGVWIYTEYKHLDTPSPLPIGQRVKMGEEVGKAGISGTTDMYYGPAGHPHLHLTAWFGATDQYRAGKSFEPLDGQWMDPLALFTTPPLDSASLAARPEADKRIPFAYFDTQGTLSQPLAKTVWPFACTRKSPAP